MKYPVRFYGNVRKEWSDGRERCIWEGGEIIYALAYDNPMPGYNTANCLFFNFLLNNIIMFL